MFCWKCGNQLSDGARFCAKCGTPVQPVQPVEPEQSAQPIQPVESVQQVQLTKAVEPEQQMPPIQPVEAELQEQPAQLVEPTQQAQPTRPVEPMQQAQPAQSVESEQPTQPAQPMPSAQPVSTDTVKKAGKEKKPKKPKKKSGKAKIIIAAAVVVAVVVAAAVSIIANAEAVSNFVHKTFTSPEEYYQYIEKQSAQQLVSQTGAMYGGMVENMLKLYNGNFTGEFSVSLSEGGQEYLALLKLAGIDLTWLQSAAIGVEYSASDSLMGWDTSLTLNEDAIVSANMLMDLDGQNMYLQVPELTQTYLGVDMGLLFEYADASQIEMLRYQREGSTQLLRTLPERVTVEKLMGRYLGIVMESISDVSVGTQNVKAGGIEQRLTELEVTIDAKTAQEIAQAVLETVQKDEDIKKIYIDYAAFIAQYSGIDINADEEWDKVCNAIDGELLELQELDDSDGEIIMKVYVDNKGEIKGRVFEWTRARMSGVSPLDSSGVTESFRMLATKKGGSFGFEMSAASGDESLSLTGSGIQEDGEVSGDFAVQYNGVSLADIAVSSLNLEKAEAGLLDGTFEVQLSSKIARLMNSYTIGSTMFDDLKLIFTFRQSVDGPSSLGMAIVYNEEELGTIAMTAQRSVGSVPVIPEGQNIVMVTNQDGAESAIEEWLGTVDWDAVIAHLESTDLPDSFIQQLQTAFFDAIHSLNSTRETVVCKREQNGVSTEIRIDADDDIITRWSQTVMMSTSEMSAVELAILDAAIEDVKDTYAAYDKVTYEARKIGSDFIEVFTIDMSDTATVQELIEAGLLPVKGNSGSNSSKLSLELTVEGLKSQGWSVE